MVCFEQLQTVLTHYANFQPEQNLQKGVRSMYLREKKKKKSTKHYFSAEGPINLKGKATTLDKHLEIRELKREQQRVNKILHTS